MCLVANLRCWSFVIFLFVGSIHGLLYGIGWLQIFGYNWDYGWSNPGSNGHRKQRVELLETEVKREKGWNYFCWEKRISNFLGVLFGWLILWYLLFMRLGLPSGTDVKLGFAELALFFLAWSGINGRLPTVAHLTQDIVSSISKVIESFAKK